MTDYVIPITNNAAQTMNIVLGGQNCVINLYQKGVNLFFDLTVSGNSLINSRFCLDRNILVFEDYLPFSGQLFFIDMQGTSDPQYQDLGTRYVLFYRL